MKNHYTMTEVMKNDETLEFRSSGLFGDWPKSFLARRLLRFACDIRSL
jgi:hypothetical protein